VADSERAAVAVSSEAVTARTAAVRTLGESSGPRQRVRNTTDRALCREGWQSVQAGEWCILVLKRDVTVSVSQVQFSGGVRRRVCSGWSKLSVSHFFLWGGVLQGLQ